MTPIELNKNTITIEEFYETAEVNSHLPNAFIYGLLNTTTNEIIYIGKTEKPIEERIN